MFESSRYAMTADAWPALLVGLLTALLGGAVILRERGSRVSWTFGLMTSMVALWLLAIGISYTALDAQLAMRWIKLEHLGVVFIPTTVLLFIATVVRRASDCRWVLMLSSLLSVVFYATILFGEGFIRGLIRYPWGYYARYGLASLPFLLFFFVVLLFSLSLLWREYRVCTLETAKRRFRALVVAFSIGYLGSIDYLATYGVPVYPCGYAPVFVFLAVAAYTIWRYHLVDITPAFAAAQIVDTMADGLLVLDRDGVIRVANAAACQLFGRAATADLVGQPVTTMWNSFLSPARLDSLLQRGTLQDQETTLISRDGQEVILSLSASVMRDAAGQPMAIVCLARDISARVKMRRALSEAHAQLEQRVEERTAELTKANAMLKSALEQRKEVEEALRQARDELEHRVVERTAKLQAMNDQLQMDISQRQQAEAALARMVAELERFTWLAVGREERILELKRRINALSRELGRPEPYDMSFAGQASRQTPSSGAIPVPAHEVNGRGQPPRRRS